MPPSIANSSVPAMGSGAVADCHSGLGGGTIAVIAVFCFFRGACHLPTRGCGERGWNFKGMPKDRKARWEREVGGDGNLH